MWKIKLQFECVLRLKIFVLKDCQNIPYDYCNQDIFPTLKSEKGPLTCL